MKLVSVIIPVYNVENYVGECLNSVLNQTYKNIEIILVNDGSQDRTALKVKEYANKYDNIKFIEIENHGQGYARNLALEQAKGEYIMFMDSDDFIDPVTIEESVKLMEKDNADVVAYDWKYFHHKNKKYIYRHADTMYFEKCLEGDDKYKILDIGAYFTVNKLYRKSLLIDNNIRYMEKYIYEDVPFWVEIAIHAKKISIIQKPYYNVRIGTISSTRSNRNTDFHYKSFITSVTETLNIIRNSNIPQEKFTPYFKYVIVRFQIYRKERVPKELRKIMTKEFISLMKDTKINYNIGNKVTKLCYKLDVFKKQKYLTFNLIIFAKDTLKKARSKFAKIKGKLRGVLRKAKAILKKNSTSNIEIQLKDNVVLFMGFDYRYTGNSRYLFEKLISKQPENMSVFFVTENKEVSDKYRIEPRSNEFRYVYNNAKVVIFESWVSPSLVKKPNTIWLQLWHGTPLKKMLFDSNEKEIMLKNKKHKINKYMDINRWNYLLADCFEAQKYFHSSFMIPESKILTIGYPRVKYLIDNIDNQKLKKQIKQEYNIPEDKIIVSYLPTWRDYNYSGTNEDFNYLVDVNTLQDKLGDKYKVIFKDHSFFSKDDKLLTLETQELLLISDYLITDYSSVMFDAFAIDLKTILYCNDYDKYQESRGIYEPMWEDLKSLSVDNMEDLVDNITNYKFNDQMKLNKQKYSYQNNSNKYLDDMIIDYFNINKPISFNKRKLLVINENSDLEKVNLKIMELKKEGFSIVVATKKENIILNNNKNIGLILRYKTKKDLEEISEIYNCYETIVL